MESRPSCWRCPALKRSSVRAGAALLALLLSGCFDRHPPEIFLPGAVSDGAVQERLLPPVPVQSLPHMEETLPPPRLLQTSATTAALEAGPAFPDEVLTLSAAIAFGLQNNPRLRVAMEQIEASRADETIAFAPFLPQVDFANHYAGFSVPVLPAAGFVPAGIAEGTNAFNLAELGLQWTLCDFGRTAGRLGQAVSRTEIAALRLERARQTVAFEVASAYFRVLEVWAFREVRQQALRQAESVLKDTQARRVGGVVDKNAVLRAEVEVSESREALVVAEQQVYDSASRLNLSMGRGVNLPVTLADVSSQPAFELSLEDSLQEAAAQRLEIGMARQAVAEALYGERAARADFLPKLYIRSSVFRVDGGAPTGWVAGAGIHLDQNLYSGGKRTGEVRKSEALVRAGIAQTQVILDHIALEVNLAFRAIAAARERIRLGETAVTQARENLRLTLVKYNNGNATPTDIVDAQTALTRSQVRYESARYEYLEALARLEYASGGDQTRLIEVVTAVEWQAVNHR